MQNSWLTLLPPLIVLVSALISRKIIYSLILGIICAALIASDFSIIPTISSILKHTLNKIKDVDNYFFFSLILILGIIITLINKTGGAQALAEAITNRSKTSKTAEKSTLILSTSLFIDDYLNTLTVGHVMLPITDKLKIPRVKLSLLVSIMAGSLAMLIPVSTWMGYIIGQLSSVISLDSKYNPFILADPFFVYLQSAPFIFYSIIIICCAWFIVLKPISYGPMHAQEVVAKETGNLFGGKKPLHSAFVSEPKHSSILDFFLPIITLILCIIVGIPYAGGFYLLGGQNSLIEAFQKANTPLVLCISSIIALSTGIIFALIRKKIKSKDVPYIIFEGLQLMYSSILLIFLAFIFGAFLEQDLGTGQYLAHLLIGKINISLLPLVIFITSTTIALSIGSAWATIAIMVPIVVPMLISLLNAQIPVELANIPLLFPCLGAIFSGAIAGNQLSPISDSTIMPSTVTGSYAIDLVRARFYYILPAIIATALAFLFTGIFINNGYLITFSTSIALGIFTAFTLMLIFQYFYKTKYNK